MDIANWLALAAVITSLFAPMLQNYHNRMLDRAQVRKKRSAPTNWRSRVDDQIERLREWMNNRKLPLVLPMMGVITATSSLIAQLWTTDPITRTTIVSIATAAAALHYQLAMIIIMQILYQQRSLRESQSKTVQILEFLVTKNSSDKGDQAA